jgi:VanZ family protein
VFEPACLVWLLFRPQRAAQLNIIVIAMSPFTSDRERRLWLWALAVVVAIYSTLGLAGTLAAELRERDLLEASFVLGLLLVVAAIAGSALKRRAGRREIWVALGVTAVYGMMLMRMFITPEERTHLFEYGLVAILIHQALTERLRHGRRVPAPAVLAVAVTALLGWLDEGIQALLPSRVYDLRDVGFNALAGLMAITASLALARARRWIGQRARSPWPVAAPSSIGNRSLPFAPVARGLEGHTHRRDAARALREASLRRRGGDPAAPDSVNQGLIVKREEAPEHKAPAASEVKGLPATPTRRARRDPR